MLPPYCRFAGFAFVCILLLVSQRVVLEWLPGVLSFVGCAFGTTYSTEESFVRCLPPVNALFLAGSALLLVDSLVVVVLSHHRTCTSVHKLVACTCCRGGDDDDSPYGCVGLVVAGSYNFAGVLGGCGKSQGVVRAGMFGWLVGSAVGLLETIPELYRRSMSSRSRSRSCCKSNASPRKRVSTSRKKLEPSETSAV
jgi:hypothetical protein